MAFSNIAKNTTTFGNVAKNLLGISYLLLESGDFLLQEDGVSKFILEESASWSTITKN